LVQWFTQPLCTMLLCSKQAGSVLCCMWMRVTSDTLLFLLCSTVGGKCHLNIWKQLCLCYWT
jgi:hypothetical protein